MALSGPRFTPRLANHAHNDSIDYTAAASTTFYPGGIVVLNAAGYLAKGTAVAGLTAVGVLGEQPHLVPATSYVSASSAGVTRLVVQKGIFKFNNSSGDALEQADIGGPCYIEDDETACQTSTDKSLLGTFVKFDDDGGVWVDVGAHPIGLGV